MSDISRQEFQRRRQALVEQMQPGSAALIFAAPEVTRSADSEYPYRQNSDFWYFTGFNEPEAVLVLIKSDDTHNHSVLFNRVRDLTAEIWFGRRLGQDAAPEKLGFMTELKEDNALLNELFSLMARERSDYTRTFRMLSLTEQHSAASPLRDEFIDRAAFVLLLAIMNLLLPVG